MPSRTESPSKTPVFPIPEVWLQAVEDPQLRDLPYKVETNEHEQLVLSPYKLRHTIYQSRIANLLLESRQASKLPEGTWLTEVSVATSRGVKVPDVAWASQERIDQVGIDAPAMTVAPELVVEVFSESNSRAEIAGKRELYFEVGAIEVWTCSRDGRMVFYDREGEIPASRLVPSFPSKID